VTQPALDDVEEDFYPCEETKDEDHIDSYRLGEVYASSGIRRRHESNGLVHEIDWALFEFEGERFPDLNHVPRIGTGAQAVKTRSLIPTTNPSTAGLSAHSAVPAAAHPAGHPTDPAAIDFQPTTVARFADLPGLEVQCMARTSGLQTGYILHPLASVKIYGRTSMSQAYQVSGRTRAPGTTAPLGFPGDSGAWIIERNSGQLCGHVLAWSHRKQVAYICPMDVLLHDIAETLEASEIRLPGGEPLVERYEKLEETYEEDDTEDDDEEDLGDLVDDEEDDRRPVPAGVKKTIRALDKMHLSTEVVS
jgi:hypothetical protein